MILESILKKFKEDGIKYYMIGVCSYSIYNLSNSITKFLGPTKEIPLNILDLMNLALAINLYKQEEKKDNPSLEKLYKKLGMKDPQKSFYT